MEQNGFGKTATGTLIPTIGGRKAFVPQKLPPVLDLNPVAELLSAASLAIGELRGIGSRRSIPLPTAMAASAGC